jgi:hypothetical protein
MPTPHPALNFWIVSLGYKDIFDESAREADLIALLKTFKRTELLVLLSKIGLVLHNDRAAHWYVPQVQMFLISAFLDSPTKRALQKKLQELTRANPGEKNFAIFAELQIVNLMKLAILHSSNDHGADISSEEERFRFGKCCLMMNDLLSIAKKKSKRE